MMTICEDEVLIIPGACSLVLSLCQGHIPTLEIYPEAGRNYPSHGICRDVIEDGKVTAVWDFQHPW